ncbi:DUF3429 domain-containing protein [Aspergillus puulaauensis]|uniref:Transmembrane protein 69 n=1 Tax=Aspergillus puulaauensis TaxID=1220207 RepID=A0A7R7XNP0_9EURO|nr:uncharacterized protein APUU_40941S [Aspergillus puulaauensis]BCS24497.1 hypothetical protein APUU_40941S [Aspergillus puulaauensis]
MWAVPSRKLNRWTERCLNFPTAADFERLIAWGTGTRSAELALFVSPNRSLPHVCIISPRPFVVSKDRLLPTSQISALPSQSSSASSCQTTMLYRQTAARSVLRAISSSNASVARSSLVNNVFKAQLTSSARSPARPSVSSSLALAPRKPVTTALVRYASTSPNKSDEDVDVMAGIKGDAKVIKQTFSLEDVPKDALYLGIAGVVPYLVTSLETVYLAYEINHANTTGDGLIFSGQSAELALHMLESVQVGYGAVILSFLGAVHWGLEWAGYGGRTGYRRYAAGVIAPAVAWPTLLLPIEHALITQFLAFTFLYYNDARASVKGLAPHWYSMYRFVLTFIVGASIVATLVGREQISGIVSRDHNISEKINALLFLQKKEKEEAAAALKAASEEEESE